MSKCNSCICKTCLIAEVNGGAPGCGDCYKCMNSNYSLHCNSCADYYNDSEAKGLTQEYFLRKMTEGENND